MSRHAPEPSLRNEDVGQAYMMMLDVYDACRAKAMAPAQIVQAIDQANPWGLTQRWRQKAWKIALREFLSDHQLPLPPERTDPVSPSPR